MQQRTLRFLLQNESMSRLIVEERDLYRNSFAELCEELISNNSLESTISEQ